MSLTRATETPIHHVFAELAAFPLASVAALRHPFIALEPLLTDFDGVGRNGHPVARLWRAAESYLLRSGCGFSVEEIVALRDELWFDHRADVPARETANFSTHSRDTLIPLTRFLRTLSERCLDASAAHPRPRQAILSRPELPEDINTREMGARRDWRWLSFALPPDFLLAALPGWDGRSARVDPLSPWLRRRFGDQGYAQSHVHMKGDYDFPLLWARVSDAIVDSPRPEAMGRSPGAELDEGCELGAWLLRAMLARFVLAWFLRRVKLGPLTNGGQNDSQNRSGSERFLLRTFMERDVRSAFLDAGSSSAYRALCDALNDLDCGQLDADLSWEDLQDAYRILRQRFVPLPLPRATLTRLRDVYRSDPLQEFFPTDDLGGATAEMAFIAASLEYLESPGALSRPGRAAAENNLRLDFAAMFWQTMRIRNLCYRHVIQRPQTPGLQWFLRFYERIGPLMGQKLATEAYIEAAAHFDGHLATPLGLRSLEVRTGLADDPVSMHQEMDEFERGWQRVASRDDDDTSWSIESESFGPVLPAELDADHGHREFGVVLHFIRNRGGGTPQGLPNRGWEGSAADPSAALNHGYRYANYYRRARSQALALGQLFRDRPEALFWIRGLDVCTDELGVPTWVLRPLLRYVHDCARQARDHLRRQQQVEVPALRTTIHAGEDFVHLLTGLRNLEQTIHHFHLGEGDRIGHGLALGIEPLRWSLRANRVPMTIDARLRDLVWELAWYRQRGSDPQTGRWHWVEEEIRRLTPQLFGCEISWQSLHAAHELLLDEMQLSRRLGFPDVPQPVLAQRAWHLQLTAEPVAAAEWIAYRYLTDAAFFQRSHRVIWVDHVAEGPVVEQLQRELRSMICQGGLTIEVNPSSNLLIGDFHDLVYHPLWRLKPPRPVDQLPPVPLCIGSDDPLNFATTLPEEFQYVLDAAMLAGLSFNEAQTWLDEVRQTGLDARFTVSRSIPPKFVHKRFPVTADLPEAPP